MLLISDTHFDDADCLLMDKGWISPEEHIRIIKKQANKGSTLIHLGDVGNPKWMSAIKAHKVLIMGNHDGASAGFEQYFDEIYRGPLMIAEKILLSHEPIEGITWALNIHGHNHDATCRDDPYHINLASNVAGWKVLSLGKVIESGALKRIKGLHRETIDAAIDRKAKRKGTDV